MRTSLLLFFSLPLVAAPAGSIAVRELSGAAQTNRTVMVSRVFARGEYPQYARPVIDGQTVSVWQNDVKTRWRDGRATVTVSGATNETPITITAPGHGFRTGEWVAISGVQGNTAANGRWRIVRLNRDSFVLQGSAGNGAYTGGGAATGPGPGSLRHVIISFVIPSLGANSTVTVNFEPTASQCSTENCQGLAQSDLLAFLGGAWDAKIKATQGNTVAVSARTMVSNGHFRYWLRGPAVTAVIAEDLSSSRSFDFGWNCTANCSGDYSTATWTSDSTNRSLHPRFTLWFFPQDGTPRVRYDYVVENTWTTLLKDQRYSIELTKSTSDVQVLTKSAFTHYGLTRWRKGGHLLTSAWQPSAPGAVNIDLNFPYLIYSKAIPMYRLDLSQGTGEINFEVTEAAALDFDINGSGHYQKYFPNTGGRPEIALWPRWMSRWLFTQNAQLYEILLKSGDVSGHIPAHFRESYTSAPKYFVDYDLDGSAHNDSGDNVADNQAFGRVLSIDARPSLTQLGWTWGDPEDRIVPLATLSSSHGWTVDLAHQSSFAYIPYLATGDPYYLEEMQFWAAYDLSASDYTSLSYGRHRSWGHINTALQVRGVAWGVRNLAHALVMSPDGTAEQEYFIQKFDQHMGVVEGEQGLTNGEHFLPLTGASTADPCPAAYTFTSFSRTQNTPWCRGRITANWFGPANPLGFPGSYSNSQLMDSTLDSSKTTEGYHPFHNLFLTLVFGHLRELDLPVNAFAKHIARWAVGGVTHPDMNKWLFVSYYAPAKRSGDGWWFQSWSKYLDAYASNCKNKAAYNDDICLGTATYTDVNDGYGPYLQAAVSLFTDVRGRRVDGATAWNWIRSNFPNQSYIVGWGTEQNLTSLKWALAPRRDPVRVRSVKSGVNALLLSYVAPGANACTITVDDNSDFSSPVVQSGDGGGSRERRFAATGLAGGTTYHYRIQCSEDPYSTSIIGSTATLTGQASTTYRLSLHPPQGRGIQSAIVEYGTTPALGSATSPLGCESSCTVDLPALSGSVLYYRWSYRDSLGGVIATSRIAAAIP